ncbi:type IV secretory system conjugative DNA transfer family protein [Paenibacillus sp. FSL W8-0919]|uniref:VirD4-like conjugal transfer protein, CD1115 family n=1 Tax=Paenibacillus sp. FSL W8-0919 TaxID=2954707 RepID=UPI0030FCE5C6
MNVDPDKQRKRTRNFLLFLAVLYLVVAYFTVHFVQVIESSKEQFQIQQLERYITSSFERIENMEAPSVNQKTLRILFLELLAFFLFAVYRITVQKNFMRGKEHGTATWGGSADRKKIADKDPLNNVILTNTERLSLNTKKFKRNLNILVVGGAGTGKSRFVVKPNLLQANTSFVVTDPKGELLRDTGYFLRSQGYNIKVFNLIDPSKSSKYNPFAYIRKESDILKLIHLLIKNTNPNKNSGGDPFWEKAETALLQAIFFYIYYELRESEHHFGTVFEMLRLAEVKEDDEEFKSEFDFLFEKLREVKPNHMAVKQYDVFRMASGKTAKSILISAGVRLSPFGISEIEELLSKDELKLTKLGDEKTALFVLIPDSDTTFNFLAAMMYSQLFDSLYYVADFENRGSLKHHVRFLLDEFANIGQIPDFDKMIATMRSRNISVTPIIQNMAQLKNLYKDAWETIVGNCDSILFLGGQERSTLEWVNKGLGKTTIDTSTSSRSRGRSGSTSVSYGIQGRELMTIDEISRMPNEKCILFVRGLSPFYSDKFKLEKHKNYKFLYDANDQYFFDPAMGVSFTENTEDTATASTDDTTSMDDTAANTASATSTDEELSVYNMRSLDMEDAALQDANIVDVGQLLEDSTDEMEAILQETK